ncbi:MAG TPA: hypothetical protein VFO42_08485 [Sphingomicrobium sp.]|nr:hypothetical protein [Sphingomicrobium sp.]
MSRPAIDPERRSAKQARARRRGGDLFLYARAFAECAERVRLLSDPPEQMLTVTCAGREWTGRAGALPEAPVVALDDLEPHCADVLIAVGVLDQVDDPALAAFILTKALKPGGRLFGAALGGRSLAHLRGALLNAERARGRAVQRVHPMLDPPSLAGLLGSVGLRDVVLDIDRVEVGYRRLDQLVADLRDMGCTSSLAGPVPPLSRGIFEQARRNFSDGREQVRETFEILHFSAVAPNAL